jgi:hypothetical protein
VKKLFFSAGLFLTGTLAWCQSAPTLSYGVKAGYITLHRLYGRTEVAGTQIYNTGSGFMDGLRWSGFARLERKRWLGQAELAYAYNLGVSNDVLAVNNMHNYSTDKSRWMMMGASPQARQVELLVTGGYKPLHWLRLSAGLGVWRVWAKNNEPLVLHDENAVPETRLAVRGHNEQNEFTYAIRHSLSPWVLTRQFGLGVDLWKHVSLDLVYDRSLTPVSKHLAYQGQQYVFRQQSDRFVVSVGYRFIRHRKYGNL